MLGQRSSAGQGSRWEKTRVPAAHSARRIYLLGVSPPARARCVNARTYGTPPLSRLRQRLRSQPRSGRHILPQHSQATRLASGCHKAQPATRRQRRALCLSVRASKPVVPGSPLQAQAGANPPSMPLLLDIIPLRDHSVKPPKRRQRHTSVQRSQHRTNTHRGPVGADDPFYRRRLRTRSAKTFRDSGPVSLPHANYSAQTLLYVVYARRPLSRPFRAAALTSPCEPQMPDRLSRCRCVAGCKNVRSQRPRMTHGVHLAGSLEQQ